MLAFSTKSFIIVSCDFEWEKTNRPVEDTYLRIQTYTLFGHQYRHTRTQHCSVSTKQWQNFLYSKAQTKRVRYRKSNENQNFPCSRLKCFVKWNERNGKETKRKKSIACSLLRTYTHNQNLSSSLLSLFVVDNTEMNGGRHGTLRIRAGKFMSKIHWMVSFR